MTNEEKAIDIAQLCPSCLNDGINGCSECGKAGKYFGALEMAEWKDQQFKEYLVNKTEPFREHLIKENEKLIDKACKWVDDNVGTLTAIALRKAMEELGRDCKK